MKKEYERHIEIERSIIKKFRKNIWTKVTDALKSYELIKEGDNVCVCISGGKDSMLLAKCIQELKKHGKVNFEVKFIIMDPGYKQENIEIIKRNLDILKIPAEIFKSDIFEIVTKVDKNSCYLCARMRRGHLYAKAKELGCNKIALGHHFDDVIETTLLSIFYGGEVKTMMPKLHSTNFEGMELIRPLYLVKEQSILDWVRYNQLLFINCACPFTEMESQDDENIGKRLEMKNLIAKLRETSPLIEMSIFRSLQNINLEAVLGYKTKGEKISFLDNYDKSNFSID